MVHGFENGKLTLFMLLELLKVANTEINKEIDKEVVRRKEFYLLLGILFGIFLERPLTQDIN